MQINIIRRFLKLEAASGVFLLGAAVLALILANSPLAASYQQFFTTPFEISLGDLRFAQPLLFWINEGLMTFFFLVVGLELKREFLQGQLATTANVILPSIAALGGMVAPAVIYVLLNWHNPMTLKGWAIPVATDIAFALGVLALFGRRIPLGLKLFLMALAIFDDIGAIIIIAIFHTANLSIIALCLAGLFVLMLLLLCYFQIRQLTPYLVIGFLLWLCVLKSGVHATVAGVILALIIPVKLGQRLEHVLHHWVAYLIMPCFALANAGVSLLGLKADLLTDTLLVGIVLALVLGKQIGIFSFSWVAVKMRWAKLPESTTWGQLYAVAVLCGIGFTMSLFLGTLAFQRDSLSYLPQVRLGVLMGSTLSGVLGAGVLYAVLQRKSKNARAK